MIYTIITKTAKIEEDYVRRYLERYERNYGYRFLNSIDYLCKKMIDSDIPIVISRSSKTVGISSIFPYLNSRENSLNYATREYILSELNTISFKQDNYYTGIDSTGNKIIWRSDRDWELKRRDVPIGNYIYTNSSGRIIKHYSYVGKLPTYNYKWTVPSSKSDIKEYRDAFEKSERETETAPTKKIEDVPIKSKRDTIQANYINVKKI